MPRGRPTKFSPEIGRRICAAVAIGQPLKQICAEAGMPPRATVLGWCADNPEFRARYTEARSHGAECLAERIVELSDSLPAVAAAAEAAGHNAHAAVNAVKIQCDNLKWLLSHWNRTYADRSSVELTGAEGRDLYPSEPDSQKLALALLSLLDRNAAPQPVVIDAEPAPAPSPPSAAALLSQSAGSDIGSDLSRPPADTSPDLGTLPEAAPDPDRLVPVYDDCPDGPKLTRRARAALEAAGLPLPARPEPTATYSAATARPGHPSQRIADDDRRVVQLPPNYYRGRRR